MRKPIKITMITPAFNSAKTIERTINSVLSQDYPNLEYIIVDGVSTDGTLDIVDKYKDKIALVISEPDHGISEAFNKGISHATGDVVGIINSDDYMLPGALQKINEEFDGTTDIYHGNILMRDPSTGYECREIPSRHFPTMPFFCHVAHQGMFVTIDAYRRLGMYDEKVRWPMDLEFLMRADRMGAKFKHIDYDMAVFVAGGFTSNNIHKKKSDYIYIVRKNGGTMLEAYVYFEFLVFTQFAKHLLNKISPNFGQKLRYKKQSKLAVSPASANSACV